MVEKALKHNEGVPLFIDREGAQGNGGNTYPVAMRSYCLLQQGSDHTLGSGVCRE